MSQLPKFVLERLRTSGSPIGHPDPDLLTAFSEQSLSAHERAVVMEHLARCHDCRDVVALALPASEGLALDGAQTHSAQTRANWLSWPALRWGFAVAGIVIVAGIVFVRYQRHSQPEMASYKNSVSNQTAQTPPEASSPKPALVPPQGQANEGAVFEERATQNAVKPVLRERADSASPAVMGKLAGVPASSGPSGRVGVKQQDLKAGGAATSVAMNAPPKELFSPTMKASPPAPAKQAPSVEPAQDAVAPRASEMVEVQSQAAPVATQDQFQDQGQNQQQDLPNAQQQKVDGDKVFVYAEGDKAMRRAKPAAPPTTVGGAVAVSGAASPQPVQTGRSVLPLGASNWTISSTGGLQRSLDGGRTWEDVNVNGNRTALALVQLDAVGNAGTLTKDSRVAENKKEKRDETAKTAARANAPIVFRAVAANGLEVWAGGSGGALYHSVDGGNQWARVFPMADSVLLTADITGIQFPDAQHGTVTTATSEIWTTSDAGRSWQRH